MEEEEEEEEEANKDSVIPITSIKVLTTGNHLSFVEGTSTITDGRTIHDPLEETNQENPKKRDAVRKFTVGAHIIVQMPRKLKKKLLMNANYTPNPHHPSLEERVRQLEVHANGSLVHRELLREQVRELEKKLAKSTSRSLVSAVRVIKQLEEKADVPNGFIAMLETTNEHLRQALVLHHMHVKKENPGTNNEGGE